MGLLCAEQNVGHLKNGLPGTMGLLCAEQNVGNLKQMTFHEFWDSSSQDNTSEISNNALSGIMGLLDHGSWIQDPRSRISWIQDPGSWIQDDGSMILDQGSWIQDPGSRILDPGYPGSRILDPGSVIQESHIS